MKYYIGSMAYGHEDIRHYGVKGMKWGVRRYQNPDGTLTEEGKARRSRLDERAEYWDKNERRVFGDNRINKLGWNLAKIDDGTFDEVDVDRKLLSKVKKAQSRKDELMHIQEDLFRSNAPIGSDEFKEILQEERRNSASLIKAIGKDFIDSVPKDLKSQAKEYIETLLAYHGYT